MAKKTLPIAGVAWLVKTENVNVTQTISQSCSQTESQQGININILYVQFVIYYILVVVSVAVVNFTFHYLIDIEGVKLYK